MKTSAEMRRDNLELLIEEAGTIEALSEKTGVSGGYLSQVRTKAPDSTKKKPRAMGDDAARRLEVGMEKETGWMDHDHSDREADLFRQLPAEVREWLIKRGDPGNQPAAAPKKKQG